MTHSRRVAIRPFRTAQLLAPTLDDVAAEAPLQIRVNGAKIAVVMRTPGDDAHLARGFLLTEAMVQSAGDIRRVAHCETLPPGGDPDNVIDVVLHDHVAFDPGEHQRSVFASSSCGVCGKASIEAVMKAAGAIDTDLDVSMAVLTSLPERLRSEQVTFEQTGGLHAAALFAPNEDRFVALFEDVGRHNAVDKCVGACIENASQRAHAVLVVSGRVSFEIVQKAVAAGIPIIVAVSAPTSLAVEAAEALGVTLVAFVRDGRANVYAGASRVS